MNLSAIVLPNANLHFSPGIQNCAFLMQRNRDSVSQVPQSLAVTTHGFAHFFSECKIRVSTASPSSGQTVISYTSHRLICPICPISPIHFAHTFLNLNPTIVQQIATVIRPTTKSPFGPKVVPVKGSQRGAHKPTRQPNAIPNHRFFFIFFFRSNSALTGVTSVCPVPAPCAFSRFATFVK